LLSWRRSLAFEVFGYPRVFPRQRFSFLLSSLKTSNGSVEKLLIVSRGIGKNSWMSGKFFRLQAIFSRVTRRFNRFGVVKTTTSCVDDNILLVVDKTTSSVNCFKTIT
jgi:hypothetical protein